MAKLISIFLNSAGVSIDSRLAAGKMFFALRGVRDGNDFAEDALRAGAVCAVVDRADVAARDERMILVDDTLTALQNMARVHREGLGIPIVAITGSNGKTTTKELTAAVLSKKYRVRATTGNLNNHIGVPLTLLSMSPETEVGIVEMGANHCGEIAALCAIAEPNYGLITNIGRAHLEGFGGEEGIRRGKGELYDWLVGNNGVALVRSTDAVLRAMVEERVGLNVEWYEDLEFDNENLVGRYNIYNMSAAAAAGRLLGVGDDDIRDAIESYVPSNLRSQRVEVAHDTTIVADCYNANPSSMELSLESFAALEDRRAKLLILGDMLELGAWSREEHRKVVEAAEKIGETWLVGNNFASVGDTHRHFKNSDELLDYLACNPIRDRLVLLKGSNGVGLNRVIDGFV